MVIKYAISPYPALHENMVAKVYEASSPNAEVASFVIVERDGSGTPTVGAGHQVPVTITFNGLDRVVHIVRLYTASATLLHEYDEEPKEDVVTVFDPIFFRIGDGAAGTPLDGQTIYTNALFSGLTAADLSISQEGLGFLLPGIDYNLTGDGVTLIGTDFENGQRWYIFKKPQVVTTIVNDSVVGKGFGGFIDIIADTDYVPSHLRKLIRLSGTGNYTFPMAADIPVGYIHAFTNFGTNPSTPQVNFLNGTLLYEGSPKSFFIIPFGSTCQFTWDGENWNFIVCNISTASAVPVSGDTIYAGNYAIGDLAANDNIYTVVHGLALAYPYKVFCTIISLAPGHIADNTIGWAAFDLLTNSFKVTMQEIFGETQNVSLDYIIVKA